MNDWLDIKPDAAYNNYINNVICTRRSIGNFVYENKLNSNPYFIQISLFSYSVIEVHCTKKKVGLG